MNTGIDYGLGQTNVDKATGIRFGVIPMHALNEWAWEGVEADYGEPHCPKCGNKAVAGDSDIPDDVEPPLGLADGESLADVDREALGYETLHHACGDYACDGCHVLFDGEDAFGDEPIGHTLNDGTYKGTVGSDNDLFVLESPYYTRAQFCSPCAPGACYLLNPTGKDGAKAYCLGHDWFDKKKAPYPIWRVADDTIVKPSIVERLEGGVL